MGFDSFCVELPQSQKFRLEPGTEGVLNPDPGRSEVVLSPVHRKPYKQSFLTISDRHAGKCEDDDKDGAQQVQAHCEPTCSAQ